MWTWLLQTIFTFSVSWFNWICMLESDLHKMPQVVVLISHNSTDISRSSTLEHGSIDNDNTLFDCWREAQAQAMRWQEWTVYILPFTKQDTCPPGLDSNLLCTHARTHNAKWYRYSCIAFLVFSLITYLLCAVIYLLHIYNETGYISCWQNEMKIWGERNRKKRPGNTCSLSEH